MAAAERPRPRPAPAPSISQTTTGNVSSNIGQALNGAIASVDSAPAMNAIAARFQPHARMMARPIERSFLKDITVDLLRRGAAGWRCCHWPEADPDPVDLGPANLGPGASSAPAWSLRGAAPRVASGL